MRYFNRAMVLMQRHKLEMLIFGSILAVIAVTGRRALESGGITERTGYSHYALLGAANYLADQDPFPDVLPSVFPGENRMHPTIRDLSNLDPYSKKCAHRVLLKVNQGRFRFSERCCPLSYIRLSSHSAILFSYGPDGRDSTTAALSVGYVDSDIERFLSTLRYDPTNGAISGGDIIRYVNVTP